MAKFFLLDNRVQQGILVLFKQKIGPKKKKKNQKSTRRHNVVLLLTSGKKLRAFVTVRMVLEGPCSNSGI